MEHNDSHAQQLASAMSAHFAALVEALDKDNPGLKEDYRAIIQKRRSQLRESQSGQHILENSLAQTYQLLGSYSDDIYKG